MRMVPKSVFHVHRAIHQASEELAVRNTKASLVGGTVQKVFVKNVHVRYNDTDFFLENPYAAYIKPCTKEELADPIKSQRLLFVEYNRFNFGADQSFQDVFFVYNCHSVCQRQVLTLGLNTGTLSTSREFLFPAVNDTFDAQLELLLERTGNDEKIKRPLRLLYSTDYAADRYEAGKYEISVSLMESVLRRTSGYTYLINVMRVRVESANSTVSFQPFLHILSFIEKRVAQISTAGVKGGLTGLVQEQTEESPPSGYDYYSAKIDPLRGQLFRLSKAPMDVFTRLFSELKGYYDILVLVQDIVMQPETVVSWAQKASSQNEIGRVFRQLEVAITANTTVERLSPLSPDGGWNRIPRPLVWSVLEGFFSSLFSPHVRVFPYLYVSYGSFLIAINRTDGANQIHCVTRGNAACAPKGLSQVVPLSLDGFVQPGSPMSGVGTAEAALIVRYEFDMDSGNLWLEMLIPCMPIDNGSSTSSVLGNATTSAGGRAPQRCFSLILPFTDLEPEVGEETVKKVVGPFTILLSPVCIQAKVSRKRWFLSARFYVSK